MTEQQPRRFVVIGLTGGIASGKSTVVAMLRELGARVIDADQLARRVVEPGAEAYNDVVAAFGPDILLPGGCIDRQALGEIVFADPAARRRLNELTHPHIRARMWAGVEAARAEGLPAVVLDIPLLIESGLQDKVDRVWVVYIDRAAQLSRLIIRDGLSREQAEARLAAQIALDEKRRHADAVIDNCGSLVATRRQVAALWRAVLAETGHMGGNALS